MPLCLVVLAGPLARAQEPITLEEPEPEFVEETFRTFRVVHGHSVETLWKNNLMFVISHRFGGTISEGIHELFGLDGTANVRLGLGYGITDNLTVGFGRSRTHKVYDGYLKYRLLRQKPGGMPITLTLMGSAAVRTLDYSSQIEESLEFRHKLSYLTQILIASKILPWWSVQLAPALVHRNFTEEQGEPNTTFALSAGTRVRFTDLFSLLVEYTHPFIEDFKTDNPRQDIFSLGFDLTTPRHTFQLQLSNTTGLIGQEYMTNTLGNFFDGDIHIGFNITYKFPL